MDKALRKKVTMAGSLPPEPVPKIRCESSALLIHCFETAL